MPLSCVVIVGAGHAGTQTAASLRQGGFSGAITLISDENELPYQRPPLSKEYLLGALDERRLAHRPQKWYDDQNVTLVYDAVVGINAQAHTVTTARGSTLNYDHLVLATGARNRELTVPGATLARVSGMRYKADADAISAWLHEGTKIIVVGAGFIGLEFASVAAKKGASVHVIEIADRPMGRAVSAPTAEFFRAAHEAWGVTFDFGLGLASIDGDDGHVRQVTTSDGRTLAADAVVYGVGVVPNTELAHAAGLAVDNGIVVDATLLSSDPDISAIGDVANFPGAAGNPGNPSVPGVLGISGADSSGLASSATMTRLESVQNAADQARYLAARLLGKVGDYRNIPWFWSQQGDLKLQIAGLSRGHDREVELAAVGRKEKVVLCFRDNTLIAVETVNRAADHMAARRLLEGGTTLVDGTALTPATALADGFELVEWERLRAPRAPDTLATPAAKAASSAR